MRLSTNLMRLSTNLMRLSTNLMRLLTSFMYLQKWNTEISWFYTIKLIIERLIFTLSINFGKSDLSAFEVKQRDFERISLIVPL
jgi:hypothetical protein